MHAALWSDNICVLLRAPARDAQGNEAEAEQGEHAGLGDLTMKS